MQGKTLLLITNSDYQYTDVMMSYCYDRFLPQGMRWRDLFDMVRCGPLTIFVPMSPVGSRPCAALGLP